MFKACGPKGKLWEVNMPAPVQGYEVTQASTSSTKVHPGIWNTSQLYSKIDEDIRNILK